MSASGQKIHLLERCFHLIDNKTTVSKELLAGLTTFVTMAYAFLLIPTMLAQTGIDFNAAMTATVIVGIYSTCMAAFFANVPFAVAPGISLIVYFTYVVSIDGGVATPVGLALCFLTGVLLWTLNTLRLRALLIETIPSALRFATIGGIGIFLAVIGLKNGGILVASTHALSFATPFGFPQIMTVVGLFLIALLMFFRVYGALFWGIVLVWIIAALFGEVEYNGVFAAPSSLSSTLFKLDVSAALTVAHIKFLLSLLFIALFDSTGSVLALSSCAKILKQKNERIKIPRVQRIFTCDATGTMLGGILGTSPNAFFLEAAAGINIGGRTGLTACTTALLFVIMLFLAPLITTIPLYATAPALIIVGGMMLRSIKEIEWSKVSEWIPAFLALILIPLTFDIALGVGVGYITYCGIKLITAQINQVHWFNWVIAAIFVLKFLLL